MGRKRLIDLDVLDRMINKDGRTNQFCAEFFGVSVVSISRAKKTLGIQVTRNVVSKSADKVISKNLNSVAQLQKINDAANSMLDEFMSLQAEGPEGCQAIDKNGNESGEIDYKLYAARLKDARDLALKTMAEIRGQLKLQLEIFQCLYDMEAVKEFQQEVLRSIGASAPDVRRRIIKNLNQANAARRATELDRD